jgi:hypothetical protein
VLGAKREGADAQLHLPKLPTALSSKVPTALSSKEKKKLERELGKAQSELTPAERLKLFLALEGAPTIPPTSSPT